MRTFRRYLPRRRVEVDGHWFDSVAESKRYGTIRMLQTAAAIRPTPVAGDIRNLKLKPKLPLWLNGRKLGSGRLTLDFEYEEWSDGAWRQVYEDCKSIDTRESKFRRQVCEAINDIHIKVVQT